MYLYIMYVGIAAVTSLSEGPILISFWGSGNFIALGICLRIMS